MKTRLIPLLASIVVSALVSSAGAVESLQEQLNAYKRESATRLPAEAKAVIGEAQERLRETGIEQAARQVGAQAIPFTLADAQGKNHSLVNLLRDGPVVLVFYRGGWCPYCNLQLAAYQEILEEIEALGGQLVAIAPEPAPAMSETVARHDLGYLVLTDDDNQVARKYGLAFELSAELRDLYLQFNLPIQTKKGTTDRYELPLPATYVVAPSGEIHWAFINADYTQRAEPADILAALKAL